MLLDIDHSELADASLSPPSPSSKPLDASASPLNAVFEALPVLAHRVYQHQAEQERSGSHAHPVHDTVDMPLLGFSISEFTDFLMKNGVASKCVSRRSCLQLHHSFAVPLLSSLPATLSLQLSHFLTELFAPLPYACPATSSSPAP